jgi:hypothetical protein
MGGNPALGGVGASPPVATRLVPTVLRGEVRPSTAEGNSGGSLGGFHPGRGLRVGQFHDLPHVEDAAGHTGQRRDQAATLRPRFASVEAGLGTRNGPMRDFMSSG